MNHITLSTVRSGANSFVPTPFGSGLEEMANTAGQEFRNFYKINDCIMDRIRLCWNSNKVPVLSLFDTLLEKESLLDVTIACEGRHLRAHKIMLAAYSPYFLELLSMDEQQHPIIILRGFKYSHVRALMSYMYQGEVVIPQQELSELLRVAQELQIHGFSDTEPSTPIGNRSKKRPVPSAISLAAAASQFSNPPDLPEHKILAKNLLENGLASHRRRQSAQQIKSITTKEKSIRPLSPTPKRPRTRASTSGSSKDPTALATVFQKQTMGNIGVSTNTIPPSDLPFTRLLTQFNPKVVETMSLNPTGVKLSQSLTNSAQLLGHSPDITAIPTIAVIPPSRIERMLTESSGSEHSLHPTESEQGKAFPDVEIDVGSMKVKLEPNDEDCDVEEALIPTPAPDFDKYKKKVEDEPVDDTTEEDSDWEATGSSEASDEDYVPLRAARKKCKRSTEKTITPHSSNIVKGAQITCN